MNIYDSAMQMIFYIFQFQLLIIALTPNNSLKVGHHLDLLQKITII